MKKARLLICFAHPDDESFGLGAAIPKWIDEGVEVFLICATDGGAGTVPTHLRDKHATIADLRLSELKCACKILKFKQVYLLDYRDSGMPGSETSQHPDSLWYSWQHDPQRVTADIEQAMLQIRPHVVVTFNRYGGYGHPDHIAIQQATVKAFHNLCAVGEDTAFRPEKLYYSSFPKFPIQWRILTARLAGQDPKRMGRNHDIDITKTLHHIEPVHTRISIVDYLDVWEQASRCHASQGGGRINRVPRWLRRVLYGRQGFTRVFPQPSQDRVDEYDLFAGVTIE